MPQVLRQSASAPEKWLSDRLHTAPLSDTHLTTHCGAGLTLPTEAIRLQEGQEPLLYVAFWPRKTHAGR